MSDKPVDVLRGRYAVGDLGRKIPRGVQSG